MTRLGAAVGILLGASVAFATPAVACGGLVAPNGTVRLLRTTTLAAWHAGVEHYVTSFQFAGNETAGEFGSIVPLPAVPTSVDRGGDWTLQRLERETAPTEQFAAASAPAAGRAGDAVQVLQQVRIDALDVTVLRGGGRAVGDWAREHGFLLTPDAPEILDHYAALSPVFLAARFDAGAARARGQRAGDGTPVHITMPLPHPWVPLRILTLGRGELEPVQADVYLLTDRRPTLLPGPRPGMELDYSGPASQSLLADLRSDKGMSWVPEDAYLSLVRIGTPAGKLSFDLSVDVAGRVPGPATPLPQPASAGAGGTSTAVLAGAGATAAALVIVAALAVAARRRRRLP